MAVALQSQYPCTSTSASPTPRPTVIMKMFADQVILVILLLASVLAGLVNTIQTFQVHFGIVPDAEVEAGPLPKVPVCSSSVRIIGVFMLIFVDRSARYVRGTCSFSIHMRVLIQIGHSVVLSLTSSAGRSLSYSPQALVLTDGVRQYLTSC